MTRSTSKTPSTLRTVWSTAPRWAEEGTSIHREVEEIRKGMAMALIKDRTVSIDEVAFLLGYPEPSTLFRSFKRWTGRTPRRPHLTSMAL